MKKMVLLLGFCLAFYTGFAQKDKTAVGDLLIGNWQPSNGRSVVQIYKGVAANGEDPNKYYGKVVWLLEPNDASGNPRVDTNNPDASKRKDPLKGMVIIKNLEFVGDAKNRTWEKGTIYDPNNGSEYSFVATLPQGNDNVMEGRGYIGVSLFGRTDTWKRLVKKN
jgi:uncharacterized protein (DUF2147 family)